MARKWAVFICLFISPVSASAETDKAKQHRLQDAWEQCLTTFAARAADRTKEDAATIVTGAFSRCQRHEDNLYRFFTTGRPQVWIDLVNDGFFDAIKKHNKDRVIAEILDVRSR